MWVLVLKCDEQCIKIKFCYKLFKMAKGTHAMLLPVNISESVSRNTYLRLIRTLSRLKGNGWRYYYVSDDRQQAKRQTTSDNATDTVRRSATVSEIMSEELNFINDSVNNAYDFNIFIYSDEAIAEIAASPRRLLFVYTCFHTIIGTF